MIAASLSFKNTHFQITDINGQPWLRGLQIASALGYKNPSSDITNLYDRNADEFTDSMTRVIELTTAGGKQQVRVFSLRGAHLLGMLARTKVAKEFRHWVLDVLERESNRPREQLTVPAIPDPFRIKEEDARHEMQKIFFTIESALHDNGVMHPDTFRDYSHGKTGKRVIGLNFWKMSLVICRIIEDIPKMVIDRSPEVRRLVDEARYDLNCDALPVPEENQSAAPKKPADSSDAQCRKREIAESHKSAIARLLTYDGDTSEIGLAECAAANEIINLSRVVSDAYENFMFSNENQNLTDEDFKCAMLELARLKNTVMELSCC